MADKIFRKGPHASKNKVVDVEAVPVSDERKTVILDENLEGVEFDDKVWLYWTRNKKSIIFSVVLAFAIIVGVQSYKLYKQHSAKALSASVRSLRVRGIDGHFCVGLPRRHADPHRTWQLQQAGQSAGSHALDVSFACFPQTLSSP